jgi:hypothetical protein
MNLIKITFKNSVLFHSKQTGLFNTSGAVRKGIVLSIILFSVTMSEIANKIEEKEF